jgi:hypothetical protein
MSFAVRIRPSSLLLLVLAGCDGGPSGPSTPFGNLRVTVLGLPSGTAASVTVSGPNSFNQSLTGTRTFPQITPGSYTVSAASVTANSREYTPNPASQTIVVPAGTGFVNANVFYSAPTGALAINITGLGSGSTAAVTVTGPGYTQDVPASTILVDLDPGSYTVTARDTVALGGTPHTASPASQAVTVVLHDTVTANVIYSPPPADGTPVNLRVADLYLTQSTQTLSDSIPLVKDRDGYLRVFVVANKSNVTAAAVRVRFFDALGPVDSVTVATGPPVPTVIDESSLSYSWNVPVPGSLIQPNLRIQADVDPAGLVIETNESDNFYPSTPLPMDVRSVPPVDVTFVPVIQMGMPPASQIRGNITSANQAQFLAPTQKMHPVSGINVMIHEDYPTATTDTLQALNGNQAWITILGEIDALRIAESSTRYYYGVVRVSYSSGVAGVAYVSNSTTGGRAALGWDKPLTAGDIAAHELGHNWGRTHSPCGDPSDLDINYPHSDGKIGSYGLDVAAETLIVRTSKDVMGYCDPKWTGGYTYRGVLNYLLDPSPPIMDAHSSAVQPALLVWGYIRNGQPVLQPAFQLNARPSLPHRPGPYALTGHAGDGTTLFSLSFTPDQVADGITDQQNFAFAVPLPSARAARLASIRLAGRGRQTVLSTAGPARPPAGVGAEARRSARGGMVIRWDAGAHPMIMVRDPRTAQVLSFARGGTVELSTFRQDVELNMSNGVRSQIQRMRVVP